MAANLSGMAQGIGYTLASLGPVAVAYCMTGRGLGATGWVFGVIGVGRDRRGLVLAVRPMLGQQREGVEAYKYLTVKVTEPSMEHHW